MEHQPQEHILIPVSQSKVTLEVKVIGFEKLVTVLTHIKEALMATPKQLEDALDAMAQAVADGFADLSQKLTDETAQVVAAIEAARGGDPTALDKAAAKVTAMRDAFAQDFTTMADEVGAIIPDVTPPPPPLTPPPTP